MGTKYRTFKLIKTEYKGFGLGEIEGSNKLVGKHTFDCEFEGGIRIKISVNNKEEIKNIKGVSLRLIQNPKK